MKFGTEIRNAQLAQSIQILRPGVWMTPAMLALVLSVLFPLLAAAQDVGTLTMREGALRLIRGTAVMQAQEGMHLRQGDIFETSAPGFAQLEFANGAVVALGPTTKFFVLRYGTSTELVLLSGWVKGQMSSGSTTYQYLTPQLTAGTTNGTLVLHATKETGELFVESGSAKVGSRSRDTDTAKAGDFISGQADKGTNVSPRIPDSFVEAMPTAFKDTLPSRFSQFAGEQAPAPKIEHEVSYSDVEPWLDMPAAWRKGLVARFKSRLSDVAFRQSVEAHLNEHPEWDRVLHPEKYQDSTASPAPPNAGQQTERYPR